MPGARDRIAQREELLGRRVGAWDEPVLGVVEDRAAGAHTTSARDERPLGKP